MNKKVRIAIIGGGSAGLFSANLLTQNLSSYEIDIYEKQDKVGKKILVSGNGKCNFTNENISGNHYNNKEFVDEIIQKYGLKETLNFYKEKGLFFKKDEEGRYYPISETSTTILELLLRDIKDKVNFYLNTKVINLEYKENKIKIFTKEFQKEYDYVLLTSGNIASNLASLDENNYLKNFNLKTTPLKPSLCPIKTKPSFKKISGLRAKCNVKLISDNKVLHQEDGELLFKDDGLSGIVIYQMTHFMNRFKKDNYHISLDFVPFLNEKSLKETISKSSLFLKDFLTGILNLKLVNELFKKDKELLLKPCNSLALKEIEKVILTLKNFKFKFISFYDLKFAQVVSGGIDLSNLSSDLKLRKYPYVYACGELIDIDGECGGYNMQFAFSSAAVAVHSIINKIKNDF